MSTLKHESSTIAIIGGGLGGLSLAVGLLRRGIACQIYEQASAFTEIGQGIAFGPNSVRAMELIDPTLADAFRVHATRNDEEDQEDVQRTWINFRCGEGPPDMIAKVQTSDDLLTGLSSVHRGRFMDELVKLIPADIAHFRKRLNSLEWLPSGQVQVSFEDGSSAVHDAVIGADGIRSSVRQIVLNRHSAYDDLSFAGTVAYRAVVPMGEAVAALGKEFAANANMYTAAGGHVLTYPIDQGENMNIVASVNKAAWTHKLPVIKNPDWKQMKEDFVGWCEPVQKTLDAMYGREIDLWGLFDSKAIPTFYKGTVALLGDAAHASLPHQGAGAGQAIEDAYIMAEVLAKADPTQPFDFVPAFKAYDAIRRPRSQKVVSTSRTAGKVYKFQSPLGSDLAKIRHDALTRFNWIWYEDMEVQAERAKAILDIQTDVRFDQEPAYETPSSLQISSVL